MDGVIRDDGAPHGVRRTMLARYSAFLVHYPGTVLLATSITSTLLPFIVLYLNPLQITQNPETVSIYLFLESPPVVQQPLGEFPTIIYLEVVPGFLLARVLF